MKVPGTHVDALRERVHGKPGLRMAEYPCLELTKGFPVGHLGGGIFAELSLSAGPLEKENHPPGHRQRQPAPEILLDESQDQVESRRGAGGRVHRPVPHVDRVWLHGHFRVPLAEATRELKTVPIERYTEAEVFFG